MVLEPQNGREYNTHVQIYASATLSLLLQAVIRSHQEGGVSLFEDLELSFRQGERIGLVGHNGCGKSTLLFLLAGLKPPDDGEVRPRKGLRLGMVEQFIPSRLEGAGVLDAVLNAAPREGESWRAQALLSQLGFDATSLDVRLCDLSGGKQTLVLFARTLLRDPDMMLLDEPSNHLDLESLVALERRLIDFRGAMVIVSHDRRFLDRVTNETLFMRDLGTERIRRPYSEAKQRLDAKDESARQARAAQDKRIDSLRRSAKRMALWGKDFDNEALSKRAKAMHKRVERLEQQRTFVSKGSPLSLSLDLDGSRSKLALRVEDAEVLHPGNPDVSLFAVHDLTLRTGDRMALLGENGAGKTSFIRMIVEAARSEESGSSSIRLSPQTRLGYFDQELMEVRGDLRMIDFMRGRVPQDSQSVTAMLAKIGFDEASRTKPISVLSGGERARLLFAVISMQRPNLLILDEPTNHLDIEGREQIEAELAASDATLLITSHDRQFTESLADRYFLIRNQTLVEIPSLDAYYEAQQDSGPKLVRSNQIAAEDSHVSEDEALERIVELEFKLEAMLRRKSKFQKPEQISRWQDEIARLNGVLEE